NTFYGAPGDAPDSLVRYLDGGQTRYRRDLKHGVAVTFDGFGRHLTTRNRAGQETRFFWSTATPIRLDSIVVPPAGVKAYRLHWNPSTRLLDSITDPTGRSLRTDMFSGR